VAWIAAAEAIVFAVYAQVALTRNKWFGLAIYAMALTMLLWAIRRESGLLGTPRALPAFPCGGTPGFVTLRSIGRHHRLCLSLLVINAIAAIISGVNSRGDDFKMEGVIAWVVSVGTFMAVFWERGRRPSGGEGESLFPASLSVSRNGWSLSFSWVILALLVILALGTGFRLWHLRQNPPEVTLDHLENATQAADHVGESEARMYILHPGDRSGLQQLQQLFPNGIAHRYRSRWERDFVLYVVPAIGGEQ
jgi:protein-S-isoprenylcysteine O-methyltransferase Ste14